MPRYRRKLPQLSGGLYLTDGGLETTLVYHEGVRLPEFAAFVLLMTEEGLAKLRTYYRRYAKIAAKHGLGFVLESMTWRASCDWGEKLGYYPQQVAKFNHKGIELLAEIRREFDETITHVVISGCIGPRGDAYRGDRATTAREAEDYHRTQIATLRRTEADLVTAFTIPDVAEATGIARAAQAEQMPAVIGFTLEADGRLPSGATLQEAIEEVDDATDAAPAYYMLNCAHPTHMLGAFHGKPRNESWAGRIGAVRANASAKSHAELNAATELDEGDPEQFGRLYRTLAEHMETLCVVGGCCGTDHRHVEAICRAMTGET